MKTRKRGPRRDRMPMWKSKKCLATEFWHRFCDVLQTPVSSSLVSAYSSSRWDSFFQKDFTTSEGGVRSFALDYQSRAMLSKYPNLPTGIDQEAVAMLTWRACEEKCEQTDERLSQSPWSEQSDVNHVLHVAREKIRACLKDVPSLKDLPLNFGGGATVDVRGDVSSYKKIHSVPSCTVSLLRELDVLNLIPGWEQAQHSLKIYRGSELQFVPKDAKTHRAICIEPTLNSMVQRAYGRYMKRVLGLRGVNLWDQQGQRQMCRRAAAEDLATVDFSSASDSIAYSVCKFLLPWEWFEVLSATRSEQYWFQGSWHDLSKFASSGNGWTFELESLLFWALAEASCAELGIPVKKGCTDSNLGVFGDDVILPAQAFPLFQRVVTHLGLTINVAKSFVSGPFRESCGMDTYEGRDVTPFRIKRQIRTSMDVMWLANSFVRWLGRCPFAFCDGFLGLYDWLVSQVPGRDRYTGPDGQGDGHFIVPWDVATPPLYCRRSPNTNWHTVEYRFLRFYEKPIKRETRRTSMAYALYAAEYGFTHSLSIQARPRYEDSLAPSLLVELEKQDEFDSHKYALRGKVEVVTKAGFVREWTEPEFGMISELLFGGQAR